MSPLADDLRRAAGLRALFFGRYNKPDWHLRLRVLGEPNWVEERAATLIAARLDDLIGRRGLARWTSAPYERELDRYGGEDGLAIAERIFHEDTRACLRFLRAEAEGRTARSRREWCLVATERYLDMLGLTRPERIEFYRYSWSFETRLGRWRNDDLEALERKYRTLEGDLAGLFGMGMRDDPTLLWGGEAPASIAADYLGAIAPPLAALRDAAAAGRIRAHPVDLAWGLTHMLCNRMQVEADAEAIIRYLMGRLHEEADLVTPP